MIGEVVKKYRLKMGYTQEEIAKRLGISQPAFSKLESGEHNFSAPQITFLLFFLEIPVDELKPGNK